MESIDILIAEGFTSDLERLARARTKLREAGLKAWLFVGGHDNNRRALLFLHTAETDVRAARLKARELIDIDKLFA